MTPYFLDNQEQRCHLSFVIFTKTENFDQSADFLSQRACWVEGQNRPDSQKITHFFCTRKHALNAPFFGK